jgi:hypothetical protein
MKCCDIYFCIAVLKRTFIFCSAYQYKLHCGPAKYLNSLQESSPTAYLWRRRWWERRYSPYSFTTSILDGVNGQHHAPASKKKLIVVKLMKRVSAFFGFAVMITGTRHWIVSGTR